MQISRTGVIENGCLQGCTGINGLYMGCNTAFGKMSFGNCQVVVHPEPNFRLET